MRFLPIVFSAFLLLGFDHPINAQERKSANETAALDSFLEKKMAEAHMVGFGAAVIVDKKVVWMKGYGYADRSRRIPYTPATLLNIASITKTFTGACMMKAAEQNLLSLDEDINRYLPFKVVNPNSPDHKITLRTIAAHTSGITDRYAFYDSIYYYGGDSPEDLGDFLKNYFTPGGKFYADSNFLKAKPGEIREYSNIAAGLAGYIVERVTGMKLNQYCRKYIFDPLRMKQSGWFLSEIDVKRHATLYDKKNGVIDSIPLYGLPTYPDGGIRSSVEELSHFFIAMLNDGEYKGRRMLKKESVQEMLRWQFTSSSKPSNVDPAKLNSGIFWATKYSGTRMGHGGTDPGVKTEMLSDLKKEVGVILFTNTTLTGAEMRAFSDMYMRLHEYGEMVRKQK